jgi:flagellar biosynthesis protein FlhF
MHLKRFRSRTVREALALAREELGPQALVLSTALVPAAGWRGLLGRREVEIAAATDREVSASWPARPEARQPEASARPVADPLVAKLCAVGFDRATAEEVVRSGGRIPKGVAAARGAVTSWAEGLCATDTDYARVEVFVGPPGAGKTTTVAKIAAQERARGGARLSLISADAFRVGAIEQLRLYADIIGVPFSAARTPGELDGAILDSRAPVLVDTAGRSPRDPAAREIFSILASEPNIRTHLVIPAGSSAKDVDRLLTTHAAARPTRVVLTRVDETYSVAQLAGVLKARGLAVSYLGTGQRVPEDLLRATPAFLAAALIGEAGLLSGSAA